MKNLTKKQKITYVVITIIILAIIGTIIGVTTHKAKKPEVIESKKTEQQIKEEVTNELPKDYKGEVDIVEEEIEVKGKDGKVEKKVVRKAVPKGQGKGKVVGTTNTNTMNTTKPNTNNTTNKPTQKPTQKPNTPNTTKPNTTKPNTTKPQRKLTPDYLKVWNTEADIAKIAQQEGLTYDYSLDPRKQNTGWTGYKSAGGKSKQADLENYRSLFKYMKEQGTTNVRIIFVDRSNYKTFTPQALGSHFRQSSYANMCDRIENWQYEEKDNKLTFWCEM